MNDILWTCGSNIRLFETHLVIALCLETQTCFDSQLFSGKTCSLMAFRTYTKHPGRVHLKLIFRSRRCTMWMEMGAQFMIWHENEHTLEDCRTAEPENFGFLRREDSGAWEISFLFWSRPGIALSHSFTRMEHFVFDHGALRHLLDRIQNDQNHQYSFLLVQCFSVLFHGFAWHYSVSNWSIFVLFAWHHQFFAAVWLVFCERGVLCHENVWRCRAPKTK